MAYEEYYEPYLCKHNFTIADALVRRETLY